MTDETKGFSLKKKYTDQVVEWSKAFVVSLSQIYLPT